MTAAKWKMSKTKAWVLFALWAFVILLVSASFLVGPAVLQSYDDAHRVSRSTATTSHLASRSGRSTISKPATDP